MTTKNTGFITNLNLISSSPFYPGFSVNYQKSFQEKSVPDSLFPVDQTNKLLGFSTSYKIPQPILNTDHRLRFSFSQTNYINDKNYTFTGSSGQYDTLTDDMNNYRFSLNTQFEAIPLESNASIYYMKSEDNRIDSLSNNSNYIGFLLREEYELNLSILQDFKPFVEINTIKSGGNTNYTKNNFSIGAKCKVAVFSIPTRLKLDISHLNYQDKAAVDEDYSRTKLRLVLTQKF